MPPAAPKSQEGEQKASVTTKSQMLSIQASSIQKISIEIGELRKDKALMNKERLIKAKLENLEKLLQLGLITQGQMQSELKDSFTVRIKPSLFCLEITIPSNITNVSGIPDNDASHIHASTLNKIR